MALPHRCRYIQRTFDGCGHFRSDIISCNNPAGCNFMVWKKQTILGLCAACEVQFGAADLFQAVTRPHQVLSYLEVGVINSMGQLPEVVGPGHPVFDGVVDPQAEQHGPGGGFNAQHAQASMQSMIRVNLPGGLIIHVPHEPVNPQAGQQAVAQATNTFFPGAGTAQWSNPAHAGPHGGSQHAGRPTNSQPQPQGSQGPEQGTALLVPVNLIDDAQQHTNQPSQPLGSSNQLPSVRAGFQVAPEAMNFSGLFSESSVESSYPSAPAPTQLQPQARPQEGQAELPTPLEPQIRAHIHEELKAFARSTSSQPAAHLPQAHLEAKFVEEDEHIKQQRQGASALGSVSTVKENATVPESANIAHNQGTSPSTSSIKLKRSCSPSSRSPKTASKRSRTINAPSTAEQARGQKEPKREAKADEVKREVKTEELKDEAEEDMK